MSDYDLKISSLKFNCEEDFSLEITISGNNFPKPADLKGTISANVITFNMNPAGTDTVNEATFTFQDSGIQTQYTFQFIHVPDGAADIRGTVDASLKGDDDYFIIEECYFNDTTSGIEEVPTMKGGLRIRKKPGVAKNYACIDLGLNPNKTSLVMTLEEAATDKLFGEFNDIEGQILTSGLNLDTSLLDGNPVPNTIGAVSMQD